MASISRDPHLSNSHSKASNTLLVNILLGGSTLGLSILSPIMVLDHSLQVLLLLGMGLDHIPVAQVLLMDLEDQVFLVHTLLLDQEDQTPTRVGQVDQTPILVDRMDRLE